MYCEFPWGSKAVMLAELVKPYWAQVLLGVAFKAPVVRVSADKAAGDGIVKKVGMLLDAVTALVRLICS